MPRGKKVTKCLGPFCCYCGRSLHGHTAHIKCAAPKCVPSDVRLCVDCYSVGAALVPHETSHPYHVIENIDTWVYAPDWTADEEMRLLSAMAEHGPANWKAISEAVGKSAVKCEAHYLAVYVNSPTYPFPDEDRLIEDIQEPCSPLPSSVPPQTPEPSICAQTPQTSFSNLHDSEKTLDANVQAADTPTTSGQISETPKPFKKSVQTRVVKRGAGDVGDNGDGALLEARARQAEEAGLEGYMPKRGDFDVEYDDNAENVIADISIGENDTAEQQRLKLRLLQIYNERLQHRESVKKFIFENDMLSFSGLKSGEPKRGTRDDKELSARLRIFLRMLSKEKYKKFEEACLSEQRIAREMYRLSQYRAAGVRSLGEIDVYEADRKKRVADITGKKINPKPVRAKSVDTPSQSVTHDDSCTSDPKDLKLGSQASIGSEADRTNPSTPSMAGQFSRSPSPNREFSEQILECAATRNEGRDGKSGVISNSNITNVPVISRLTQSIRKANDRDAQAPNAGVPTSGICASPQLKTLTETDVANLQNSLDNGNVSQIEQSTPLKPDGVVLHGQGGASARRSIEKIINCVAQNTSHTPGQGIPVQAIAVNASNEGNSASLPPASASALGSQRQRPPPKRTRTSLNGLLGKPRRTPTPRKDRVSPYPAVEAVQVSHLPGTERLSEEELKVCSALSMHPEYFLAARDAAIAETCVAIHKPLLSSQKQVPGTYIARVSINQEDENSDKATGDYTDILISRQLLSSDTHRARACFKQSSRKRSQVDGLSQPIKIHHVNQQQLVQQPTIHVNDSFSRRGLSKISVRMPGRVTRSVARKAEALLEGQRSFDLHSRIQAERSTINSYAFDLNNNLGGVVTTQRGQDNLQGEVKTEVAEVAKLDSEGNAARDSVNIPVASSSPSRMEKDGTDSSALDTAHAKLLAGSIAQSAVEQETACGKPLHLASHKTITSDGTVEVPRTISERSREKDATYGQTKNASDVIAVPKASSSTVVKIEVKKEAINAVPSPNITRKEASKDPIHLPIQSLGKSIMGNPLADANASKELSNGTAYEKKDTHASTLVKNVNSAPSKNRERTPREVDNYCKGDISVASNRKSELLDNTCEKEVVNEEIGNVLMKANSLGEFPITSKPLPSEQTNSLKQTPLENTGTEKRDRSVYEPGPSSALINTTIDSPVVQKSEPYSGVLQNSALVSICEEKLANENVVIESLPVNPRIDVKSRESNDIVVFNRNDASVETEQDEVELSTLFIAKAGRRKLVSADTDSETDHNASQTSTEYRRRSRRLAPSPVQKDSQEPRRTSSRNTAKKTRDESPTDSLSEEKGSVDNDVETISLYNRARRNRARKEQGDSDSRELGIHVSSSVKRAIRSCRLRKDARRLSDILSIEDSSSQTESDDESNNDQPAKFQPLRRSARVSNRKKRQRPDSGDETPQLRRSKRTRRLTFTPGKFAVDGRDASDASHAPSDPTRELPRRRASARLRQQV